MASLSSPPIRTLSGFFKSLIAVPSAKNSGFERTENVLVIEDLFISSVAASRIALIVWAVLTGNVLFSTTIVWPFAYFDISLDDASTYLRSIACPDPIPLVLVGVLTEIKIYRNIL